MIRTSDADADRLAEGMQRVLSRPAGDQEQRLLLELLSDYRDEFRQDPLGAKELVSVGDSAPPKNIPADELAAWTMVATTILNLGEAVTKQ